MSYSILVPVNFKQTNYISGGSGIVASTEEYLDPDKDMIRVYYEGNINQACNLNSLYDRVLVAAGRMHVRYPTVAFSVVSKKDYLAVGTFVYEGFDMLIDDASLGAVNSWLGEDKRTVSVYRK